MAQTNNAVDNIARKLVMNSVRVLRVGNAKQISPDLYGVTIDGQLEKLSLSAGKRSHNRDEYGNTYRSKALLQKILTSSQVICCTCVSCGDPLLENEKFNLVVMDEATLTTEPVSIIPIAHGARQLVLIGDQQQLAPMTAFTSCSQPILYDVPSVEELSTTLFHRLQRNMATVQLNIQYRMHPALAAFPSRMFYHGRLINGIKTVDRIPPVFPWPRNDTPLCIISDEQGTEVFSEGSYYNLSQANIVLKVLRALLQGGASYQDIVLLVPYASQARKLKELVKEGGLDVVVTSIDSFQGRETDVVVFCTVRTGRTLGFLSDKRRINVLLTRARKGLIGVGNIQTLRDSSDDWAEWLRLAPLLNLSDLDLWGRKSFSSRTRPHAHAPSGKAR